MDEDEPSRRRAARFLLVLLALIALGSFILLRPIVSGATFGLVVGFLLQGPYRRTAKRVGRPRVVAVLFVVLLCVAIDVPLFLLGWELMNELRAFGEQVASPDFLPNMAHALTRFGVPDAAAQSLVDQARTDAAAWLHNAALPTLNFVGQLLMNTGVFLFVLYYTLVSGPELEAWVRDALPLPYARRQHLIDAVAARMHNLFMGTFLVATCMGILSGLVWWLLGFPNPVFWGAVMTVLSLIPALGTGIVIFPASAIAIALGYVWQGVTLLAWMMLASPFVANGIRAAFVGRTRGVHPILVLVGTVGGIAFFGPAGFLLGPLILSMADPVISEWQLLHGSGAADPQPELPDP